LLLVRSSTDPPIIIPSMKNSNTGTKIRREVLLVVAMTMLFAGEALSQQGSIRGRVYNEMTNEPLPFTNIIIYGTNTGSTSDLDGYFLFTGLTPGFVRLQVSAVGFEGRVTEEFMVTNARTANIDIGMREIRVELASVEVTASPFERSEESPVSLRRIGIQEIERSPGSNRDISRVIQSLPGVGFTPSFRNDVIIRGGGPSENSFFLDGVEIPNINHFATQGASGGPVGIINVDFIREVEMYTGAFPANRGNALSSVFEFRQVNGNQEKLNFRGTLGASDVALTADGPLTQNTSFILSARRSYLQYLFSVVGLPFLPTYNGFQFKTNTKTGPRSELSFIGIGAIDQFQLNLGANETEEQRFILDYLPVNEQWNYALGGVYRQFRDNGFDTWVLSRNMLRNTAFKYPGNNENLPRSLDYLSDEIENKIRFERLLNIGNTRVRFGAGGEYARFSSDTYQEVFLFDQLQVIDFESALDLFKWSFFAQATRRLMDDRLSLSLGIRADANNYRPLMANPLRQLSPRFSASYKLQENFSLNFNTGRYFQLPAYTTMGFRNNDGQLVNRENGLRYISVDHLVAGIEWLPTGSSIISLEGFYKDYDNYPFSVRDSVVLGSRSADFGVFGAEEVVSTGEGRAFGAELLLREQRFRGFNLILSYTFVRSEFKDIANNYVPAAWDNRHIVILTALRKLPRNWDVGLKWRFSGGAPYTPYDLEKSSIRDAWDVQGMPYLDYSRFNRERLRAFHQLDLRVDKQFFLDRWSLMLYLDVQNVYNFKADQPANYVRVEDAAGKPVVISDNGVERYELKRLENLIGSVLPSVGIILEF
jgi:outer membrane receptor for ferrienterochelin and colicin